jgi:hypothetical protein
MKAIEEKRTCSRHALGARGDSPHGPRRRFTLSIARGVRGRGGEQREKGKRA